MSSSPPPAGKPEDTLELVTVEEQEEFLQVLKQLNLASAPPTGPAPDRAALAAQKDFKFWKTQPVPALDEFPREHGAIDPPKRAADVRREPFNMPPGFTWSEIDLAEANEAQEVYDLLTRNYVEDDDNMFRFDYSIDFLMWALTPPGYVKDWHVGVRNQKTGKLMAFISGIPVKTRVYQDSPMAMAEINFLCVHKKLRTKRLAPVLIKEVTRRVNLRDVWQAVYTAGVVLPMPVAQCRYFHRSLNPKKLIDVGFSRLAPRMTMTRTIKMFKLPEATSVPGFRPMHKKDVAQVTALLKTYLAKFDLVQHYDQNDVAHWMLPRAGVISAYVVENPETHKITDFTSFYHLPSTVIGHEKHSKLNAAYSFYNVATSVPLTDLMHDTLVMAKKEDFDVFNALSLMDNMEFLKELKFGPGDGDLMYYLYNWRCPRMEGNKVGIVLC
ncbi:glycylpeptide N-tetradecanoyltransferase [Phytophthora pseudosyringae]|uniref:Glycylpeptide N-tetradecanoyltransferase n=1 Tax=Phytophthora pseudosyringae TaxID=221518 RepID=A0A8T1VGU5_9STRA|nr:glycylpeptide N-tetradecanoyltransferase [Phytophthora pseudosyringae]